MIPLARPIVGDDEVQAVERVLRSGALAQGPEVARFESEFSAYVRGRNCIAVNSGTSALHLALLALGIGPTDEVIVPSFTFAATANSVRLAGATPIFADIDIDTFCLNPKSVNEAITERTAAIMPVHLYGQPADMAAIKDIADHHGLAVIEDAAQAHMAQHPLGPVGALGDAAAFSFYPTKNMTAGEGGMLVIPDDGRARLARLLRNQGMDRRYENEVVGFNLRMTDIHAAIGRTQLRQLPDWTALRQRNAAALDAGLVGIKCPSVSQGCTHVYHQYTLRISAEIRDEAITQIQRNGVEVGVYYPTPVHRLPSFGMCDRCTSAGGRCDRLPETERAASECLSLPVHPSLTAEDIKQIIDTVNTVLEGLLR
jgi:dTDP-4-amino-4,6-dideoxygalactose transaminase